MMPELDLNRKGEATMTFTCGRCGQEPPCPHWGVRDRPNQVRTYYKILGMWTPAALAAERAMKETV